MQMYSVGQWIRKALCHARARKIIKTKRTGVLLVGNFDFYLILLSYIILCTISKIRRFLRNVKYLIKIVVIILLRSSI